MNVQAPELKIEKWINTDQAQTIEGMQGSVIALHTFQMLCPGCILHGLPQAERLHQFFKPKGLNLIGIHTVFENHPAMQEHALRVFINEFRYSFPIAIDKAGTQNNGLPQTMQSYGCKGTPSFILIDKKGFIRNHYFGNIEDLLISHEITNLLNESFPAKDHTDPKKREA